MVTIFTQVHTEMNQAQSIKQHVNNGDCAYLAEHRPRLAQTLSKIRQQQQNCERKKCNNKLHKSTCYIT